MEECLVCKESYSEQKIPFELECTHTFCKECVLDTFKRDCRCPLCRREYDIIIKLKKDDIQLQHIHPFIRDILRRIPLDGHTIDTLNRVELIIYRTYRRIEHIINIIYKPSCKFILNDQCKLEMSVHAIFMISFTMILWFILSYIYS